MEIIDKLIDKAKSQIGVKESPFGSNKQKYGEKYGYNGVAWCCIFIWWLFNECGASNLFYGGNKTASCTTLMNYYKSKGQFSSTPKKGSLVFFQFDTDAYADHVGIVIDVNSDGTITTIEGNTGTTSNANGGCVMQRTRNKSVVMGYAYPYGNISTSTTGGKCEVKLNTLQKGSKCKSVKALQILLIGNGYSCGSYGADGDFGNATVAAVKQFQKDNSLSVDGIVGTNTWTKLLS
mgnify:CR=1 FL=1